MRKMIFVVVLLTSLQQISCKKQEAVPDEKIVSQITATAKITGSEIENLKSKMSPVEWLKPIEVKDDGLRLYRGAFASKSAMKQATGRLSYAIENFPESENMVSYLLEISHKLVELQEDRQALFWINKLVNHPKSKGYQFRSHWMNEIDCAQKKGLFLKLKVYSRNNLEQEVDSLVALIEPSIPKEHLMVAEAYAVMGMNDKAIAALEHCVTSGEHFPYEGDASGPHNPGWVMNQEASTRASAAVLAFGLGNLDLARRIAEPVINDEKLKNHAWTSRRVSWQVLNDIYNKSNTASLANLKDGTYSGVSIGYVNNIEVSVVVENGKIANIEVTYTQEDRPFNSIEAMPLRLMAYNGVSDAVSGATITSSAISMAVYDAILKAAKNEAGGE